MNRTRLHVGVLVVLLAAGPAKAQDAPTTVSVLDGLDTLWVLIAAALVFFMQAGFSVLEAGLVRTKNAGNVLMKNLLDFAFAALGYFIFGYAIMYGTEGLLFGTDGWFLVDVTSPVEGLPTEVFWLFQAVFAGAAATIVAPVPSPARHTRRGSTGSFRRRYAHARSTATRIADRSSSEVSGHVHRPPRPRSSEPPSIWLYFAAPGRFRATSRLECSAIKT